MTNPEKAFEYLKEYLRQRENFNAGERLKSIDKKLLSLENKEERLAELYSEGIIDIGIYRKQWEKCKTEGEKLLRGREFLLQSVANENGKSEILDSLKTFYNSLKESLKRATREIKYGIIKEACFKEFGVIVIDLSLHPYKKRHLIAHGLAHYLFHSNSKANYFLEDKSELFNNWIVKQYEKETGFFAAYLLIPEDKLNELLKQEWVKESPDPIPELTEEFQVSENFMRKRLKFETLF